MGVTAVQERRFRPVFAYFGIGWLLAAEGLRELNLQGPLTVISAATLIVLFPMVLLRRKRLMELNRMATAYLVCVGVFVGWTAIRLYSSEGISKNAIQNVSVFMVFMVLMLLVASDQTRIDPRKLVTATCVFAALGSFPFIVIAVVSGGVGSRYIGTGSVTGVASIGLIAAVVMRRRVFTSFVSICFFVVIFASLSRAYIVCALVLLTVPSLHDYSVRVFAKKWVVRTFIVGIVGIAILTFYAPLKDRFVINDGASLAGIDVGTSGRDNLWSTLLRFMNPGSYLVGHGAGQSEILITKFFTTITQPHNDYLRLLYDYGIVGLVLWSVSLILAVFMIRRRLRSFGTDEFAQNFASLLFLILLALNSIFDNVIIYVFIMAPLAVFIGSGINNDAREMDSPSRETPIVDAD